MKPTFPTLFLAATLCASALVMPAARAQDDFPVMDWGPMIMTEAQNSVTQSIMDGERAKLRDINQGASSGPKVASGKAPTARGARAKTKMVPKVTPKLAPVVTTYHESSAVSQRMQAHFIASLIQGLSPEDAAKSKRDLAGQDFVAMWAGDATSNGLKRGDVADALAFYLVDSYLAANNLPSAQAAQFRGMRRQMARSMASNAAFATLSNQARQEMAEGLIYAQFTQRLLGEFAQKRGDEAAQESRDAIAARFKKSMGIDLRNVKLTDAGFAAKG